MRRLALIPVIAAALVGVSQAQVWEKFLMPGLSYRMEIDPSGPRHIHVIRFAAGVRGLTAKPEVSGGRIFALPTDQGRETLTEMVSRTGAIGGINADFFPFTADPLGAMMRDGVLVSRPDPRRAVFAWGPGGATIAVLGWRGTVTKIGGSAIGLNGMNEECMENSIVLNTDGVAEAQAKNPCVHAVLKLEEQGPWGARVTRKAQVVEVREDLERLPVSKDTVVLTGRGTRAAEVRALQQGDNVSIQWDLTGIDTAQYDQIVGGGPFLIRNGKEFIDAEGQGFQKGFYQNRHPRTAMGLTARGEVVMVVVDGRQEMSVGASLQELADIMERLECVQAINLDGGGSSTINLFGLTLNRPSDGSERKVANSVLLFGPARPAPATPEWTLEAPAEMTAGQATNLRILDANKRPVPNAEILWGAQGNAWIDQGGRLRGLKEGEATVSAWVRGVLIRAKVSVKAAPGPVPGSAAPRR